MKLLFRFSLIMGLFTAQLCLAQITMPTSRIVFQRGNDNRASLPVQGNCPANATSIQAKATALNGGQSTDWTTVTTTTTNGTFQGTMSLVGGWYSLQVRALSSGNEVGNWLVDRVGVGEVLVIAGQSNIVGSPLARNLSATDDRVSTINYRGYPDGRITEGDLPTSFINAANNSPIGPENNMLFWGDLGDKMVARLGVPVLFLGGAYGGTSSANWRDAAVNGTYEMDTQGGHVIRNAPYRPLGVALQYYVKRTGARAVIWHQGESDPYTAQGEYVNNITQLINKTRSQTGLSRLSWMICRATYFQGVTNPNVINAQNQLADANNNCFPGPATDWMSGTKDWRFDNGHINDDKYPIFEGLFNDLLTTDYFSRSAPSLPASFPAITTGYIFPHELNGGSHIQVPYMATAPVAADNQYSVQLLAENGDVLANLGTGNVVGNRLIDVVLPVWADGRVRVRVNSSSPARTGEASEFFIVHKTGDRPSSNPVLNSAYAALNFTIGQPVNLSVPANFSDPNNLALTYSWQNLPAGLSASGLTISGTPSGSVGSFNATLTATNSQNQSASATVPITYTLPTPNVDPPFSAGSANGTGLLGTFYNNVSFSGASVLQQMNPTINYSWDGDRSSPFPGVNSSNISARWTGWIEAPVSGVFTISSNNDDGTSLWVNGQQLTNDIADNHAPLLKSGTITLVAGQKYAIRIDYYQGGGGAQAQLLWNYPGQNQQLVPQTRLYPEATTTTVVETPSTPTTPTTPPVTANPVSGSYEGYVDGKNCTSFMGWVYNRNAPNEAVTLEVLKGSEVVYTGVASTYRPDLVPAGKGNGYHGYSFALPAGLKTGSSVNVTVRVQNSGYVLTNGMFSLTCGGSSRLAAPSEAEATAEFRVFPNPAIDLIRVQVPSLYDGADLGLSLVSMDGREQPIERISSETGTLKANIRAVPMGLYLLRVSADGRPVSILKLLKQ